MGRNRYVREEHLVIILKSKEFVAIKHSPEEWVLFGMDNYKTISNIRQHMTIKEFFYELCDFYTDRNIQSVRLGVMVQKLLNERIH